MLPIGPAALLTGDARAARKRIGRLDLRVEQAGDGADTPGGVRVSVPAGA